MFKISISVKGIDRVQALLKRAQQGSKGFVAREVATYLVGDERHGLRHYAPWRKVTRRSAYGVTFFSNEQQRGFFAKLKSGEINVPYVRTGAQGKAWMIEGQSTNIRIVNRDPSVKWTRGQTRLHAKMGWQTAMATIKSNMTGALKKGKEALIRWLNSL